MTVHHSSMDTKMLLQNYKTLIDSLVVDPEAVNYEIMRHHTGLLERLAVVENSSMRIMDLFQKKYIFIRNRFKAHLSWNESEAEERGYSYFFSLMHPDDLPLVLDTSIKSLKFLIDTEPAERMKYKSFFEFRLRDPSGQYVRFIQQNMVLELDLKGNIWLILILLDLCPNQQDSKMFQRSMVNMRDNKVCLFNEDSHTGNIQLSKRETEILGLLSKGMISKEIADKLFISVNTVNNHRQKIIEKMDVANTSEALSYAEKIGII